MTVDFQSVVFLPITKSERRVFLVAVIAWHTVVRFGSRRCENGIAVRFSRVSRIGPIGAVEIAAMNQSLVRPPNLAGQKLFCRHTRITFGGNQIPEKNTRNSILFVWRATQRAGMVESEFQQRVRRKLRMHRPG